MIKKYLISDLKKNINTKVTYLWGENLAFIFIIFIFSTDSTGTENLEAFTQLANLQKPVSLDTKDNKPNISQTYEGLSEEADIQLNSLIESLAKRAPDAIDLSPEAVANLKEESNKSSALKESHNKPNDQASSLAESSLSATNKQTTVDSHGKVPSGEEKDCVLFTCGHHFTSAEFKVMWIFF